jgi:hypothetical protein
MNQLNKPLQGSGENVLTSSAKIFGFKRKLSLWKNHILKGNLEIFPLLLGLESEEGYQEFSSFIENHHQELRNQIKHYFPCLPTEIYDWVRKPCSESSAQPENLTLREEEEEELCELRSDRTLNMRFADLSRGKF